MMKPGTILYAEDESDDVFFLKLAFQKAGLQNPLETVRDGQKAVEYLSGAGPFADRERHPLPCLVLLDINMPKKSGFDVLQWIREQPDLKKLPVLMLTSSSRSGDMEQARKLDASDYLLKPSDPSHLVGMVTALHQRWLAQLPVEAA